MDINFINSIIARVDIGIPAKWTVVESGAGFLVQLCFDAYNGPQKSRKWYISQHAITSEVVSTLFKATLTAMEHELRENFKYKGRAIFGPHFNAEVLWMMAVPNAQEVRRETL